MKLKLTLLILSGVYILNAQSLIKSNFKNPLTFKEIQLQYNSIKEQKDVKEEKNWKIFKRWESDMQLRFNPQGEPIGFEEYVKAVSEMAEFKQKQEAVNASANWAPSRPSVLSKNLTGNLENGIGRVNCIAFHPTKSDIFYASTTERGLWKTINNGVDWAPLAVNLSKAFSPPNTEICALAVAPTDNAIIYAARRARKDLGVTAAIIKTVNGGTSFSNVSSNLPDSLYYTGVEVSNTNADVAYVAMAGYVAGSKVYVTNDGGATWQNITFNLPNVPINCIKQIPGSNNLIIATDVGVYVLSEGANNWLNTSFGLPNVIVSDIEFNVKLNKTYVSTIEGGIWETSYTLLTAVGDKESNVLDFVLFPSPNGGSFTLKLEDDNIEKGIQVLDVTGNIVYAQNTKLPMVDVNLNASSGEYYVKIVSRGKMGVKKLIVE